MDIDDLREFEEELQNDYPDVWELCLQLMEAHGPQLYGWRPYYYHLLHTAYLGAGYGFDTPFWLKCFLLHDSVEDTDITLELITAEHGPRVAAMVDAVTGTNGTRKEHCAAQYVKIKALPQAAVVKAMDRLSHWENLCDNFQEDPEKYTRLIRMYDGEAEEFLELVRGKISPQMLEDLESARGRAVALLQ